MSVAEVAKNPKHRPIDPADQRVLARWAADCAAKVLPIFEAERPQDRRPRAAVGAVRRWARGEATVNESRLAALAAHAAARAAKTDSARNAARAAGHAAGTAHVWSHCAGAADYAASAAEGRPWNDARKNPGRSRKAQARLLPKRLQAMVFPPPKLR